MTVRGGLVAAALLLLCAACGPGGGEQDPDAGATAGTPAEDAAGDAGTASGDADREDRTPSGDAARGDEAARDPAATDAGSTGDAAATATGDEAAGGAVAPLASVAVTLYFPSAVGDDLVPERGEIFDTASPVDRAKQILSDLIAGPNEIYSMRFLPPDTRLRQVYVTADGVAWADFAAGLASGIGGGSAREVLAVYAIVDSLALNIPEIDRVGILIDGEPVETLNGHVDLRRPLPADRSLIGRRPSAADLEALEVVRAAPRP